MSSDIESYEENYSEDKDHSDIEDLESRIEDLENSQNQNSGSAAMVVYIPGLVLAMILSYTANQSILWAIIDGYLSWLYVIYKVFF